jgi:TetR/AcrR family transcriptional regulator, regulator of biofilm formation and stress response
MTVSRRETIIGAAATLIREGGPGALTHRAVADAAAVPLAATTYYFASKDELLGEALAVAAGAEVERLTELAAVLDQAVAAGDDPPATIARLLAGALAAEYGAVATKFEVYLAAHRRPELRAHCERWIGAFVALAERAMRRAGAADPAAAGALFVAAVDGLLLRRLATADALDEPHLAAQLDVLVRALSGAPGAR